MLVIGVFYNLQGFRRVILFDVIVDNVLKRLRIKKILVMITNHFFVTFNRKLGVLGESKFKVFFHSIYFSERELPPAQ